MFQKGFARIIIIFDNIKQKFFARPFWQRLVLGIAVFLITTFLVYALVNTSGKQSFEKTQPIQSTLSITCPDNILYDQNSKMPIWVKGNERKNISGEEDQWIRKNCAGFPNNTRTQNNNSLKSTVSTNPLFGLPCKNDPKPIFTHDLTDPGLIDHIQIYGLGESTPRFRSFLSINSVKTVKVPVYAPIDSDLVEAVYKTIIKQSQPVTDFDVHLMVSCQVWYLVNHITDPVDKIRQALPATPVTNTMDPPKISPPIHFAAGELLGYTSGTPNSSHGWDFGVFDLTHANQFVNQARFDRDKYGKVQTAICPFDVFPNAQKAVYYSLFGETKPVASAKCGPISPDKVGTISGSWFDIADTSQPQLHFKLMIGTYNDGIIRISGEDFQPPIEITPINPTYLEPLSITTRHCYAAGNQMVDFRVVSDQQIQVYSGSGSCSVVFPATSFKTYYR